MARTTSDHARLDHRSPVSSLRAELVTLTTPDPLTDMAILADAASDVVTTGVPMGVALREALRDVPGAIGTAVGAVAAPAVAGPSPSFTSSAVCSLGSVSTLVGSPCASYLCVQLMN